MKTSSPLLCLAAAVLLSACAVNPGQADKVPEAGFAGPVFYPQLPNAPRIQYLTTIASERDLAPSKDGFADFIVGEEKAAQQLVQPYGVALHRNQLIVADTGAGGLAIFDLLGQRFRLFTGNGPGRMKRPINVRIDADGTKYVTDTARNQILVYDKDERFIKALGVEGQFRPVDVAIGADRLYVADILHHQIHVVDKASGRTLLSFGKAGSGVAELYHPTNVALGPEGDVYVVDTGNYRVQRFSAEGQLLRSYGEVGSTSGSFARPKGIAIDRAGRIYVGDAAFQNVQIFDNRGKLLLFFGQTEGSADNLNLPAGVSIDYENISAFSRFADARFAIEYLILVASQYGPNKVDVFAFGKLGGMDYPPDAGPAS